MIEDGKAVCAEWGAAQIRVAVAEVPAAGEGFSTAMAHESTSDFPGGAIPAIPTPWSFALRPCALAAAVAVGLMFLGLNPFIAALLWGFVAPPFFQPHTPSFPLVSTPYARHRAF